MTEEEDQGIFDYENPVTCLKRNSDFKDRAVIPELITDIEATKTLINDCKHTADEALSQLDSINLQYLRYSRGQL